MIKMDDLCLNKYHNIIVKNGRCALEDRFSAVKIDDAHKHHYSMIVIDSSCLKKHDGIVKIDDF